MTTYLQKHALFPTQIITQPHPKLGIVIVIPCYNEPNLLQSLWTLKNCLPTTCSVEIIVVINGCQERDNATTQQQNAHTFEEAKKWMSQHSTAMRQFHVLYHPDLPKKFAGVGLARKIGMDEAVRRLQKINYAEGVIVGFDADSQCASNYLLAIEQHFRLHPDTQACSIYFEHPIEGNAYSLATYAAIVEYELFLRYYVNALRYAGHPHAYQTVGSSMAVRASAYQQQGGMNRRKAGEDFYFLQKFIALNKFSELNNTMVIPSPRPSDRVPFGTGKAVATILQQKTTIYNSYHPQSFEDLKHFITSIPSLYKLEQEAQLVDFLKKQAESIQHFLRILPFVVKVTEIKRHTKSQCTFIQRFFRWFNAFVVLKYVHFARDHFYANIPIQDASQILLQKTTSIKTFKSLTTKELLLYFRQLDGNMVTTFSNAK